MRKLFDAYLKKTTENFDELWKSCEFTFDTNVLLGLYSANSDLVDDLFTVWQAIEERIFLTHQAGLEFYRNRSEVIQRVRNTFQSYATQTAEIPAAFSKDAAEKLQELLNQEGKSLEKFLQNDPLERRISDTFDGKITEPTTDYAQAYAAIDTRYALRMPPGFADAGKPDYSKYGDAVMWLQMIERARISKKPVVFVTSEKKPDWWLKSNDGKTIGPRPELALEMRTQANVSFHMYALDQFINFAKKFLNLQDTATDAQTTRAVAEAEAASSGKARINGFVIPSVTDLGGGTQNYIPVPVSGAWAPLLPYANNVFADSSAGFGGPVYGGLINTNADIYGTFEGGSISSWKQQQATAILERALRNFGFPLGQERAAIAEALNLLRSARHEMLFPQVISTSPFSAHPSDDQSELVTEASADIVHAEPAIEDPHQED